MRGRIGSQLALMMVGLFLLHPLPQQNPAQPVFRSGTDVILFDVSVLDKNRQPVRGLTDKDFTVLEDGRVQRIVGVSTVDIAQGESATGWMSEVRSDVFANGIKENARLFVLVLDDALVPQEPWAIRASKDIAKRIVNRLAPADLMAIAFTSNDADAQDFTGDKSRLLGAVDRFNPGLAGYRFGLETGVDVDLPFYRASIRTLGTVTDALATVPQRRKAVFWVSPGVPMDLCGVTPEPPGRPPRPPSPCRVPPHDMVDLAQRIQDVFWRAQRANVSIYPIDPVGLGGMRAYLSTRVSEATAQIKTGAQQDFLAATARNTGGRTVMNINEFTKGVDDAFSENSFYYLIGFEPSHSAPDGKLRNVQVKVNRKGLEVRSRTGYYAERPPSMQRVSDPPFSSNRASLANAIGGVLPDAGVPMHAVVAPFASLGNGLSTVAIVVSIEETLDRPVRGTRTTELRSSVFAGTDPKTEQNLTANVTMHPDAKGPAAYELLSSVDLPPGRYQIRLAAHEVNSGKDGSVYADVTVPDYFGLPFSASPIVLSSTSAPASAPSDFLARLLPVVPTAKRDFLTTDDLTAFVRLYQNGDGLQSVRLSVSVRDGSEHLSYADDRVIGTDRFEISGRPEGSPTSPKALHAADVRYDVPLRNLVLGPNLLRIEASSGSTTVRREVRFAVK